MSDPNKIPSINTGDIQKVNEYTKAFDSLRSSVNGLTQKMPEFSNGMAAGLKAIGEKLPDVVDSMIKLNAQNKELAASGQKPVSVLSQLASSLFSWNSLVSVGITLLTTYGGTILTWVSEMMNGKTTLSALGQAMKNNANIAEALIQTKLKSTQAAQGEITDLNVLYNATQSHTLSLKQKKEAINALKEQWPGIFKNISDEAIMIGKATYAYKKLKEQIMATAYAEAAKNKITENSGRVFENDQKIIKERAKNLKIVADQKALEMEANKDDDSMDEFGVRLRNYNARSEDIKASRDASDKIIYNLTTDTNLLKTQNDKFYQEIEKRIKLFNLSITGHQKAIASYNAPKIPKSRSNDNKPDPTQQLKAIGINFAQTIELEKKNYDIEQALLDQQLNKKLLSQQEYQEKSNQLLDTYHKNIGANVKDFQDVNLADAQKNMQDMVNADQHNNVMSSDLHDVDKAILPADKLTAEKKQLTDKYDYEISLAANNTSKITQLEEQKQTELTELSKKYEQERNDFAMKSAQQVSNTAFSILQNSIKSQSDNKIKQLETQKQTELNNTSLTASQKQAIEDKYKKKEAEEKVKAFKDEQKASILQAVINGALAVTKATAQTGVLSAFVIPGIIAETAIQVATIAAQKPPQYAKGGLHYQSDGKGALLSGYSRTDNTNAYLRSGEAVVVSEAMRNPWARNLVSAINVAYGGRDFSATNPGRGYAIGGIFTDGGNSNRYYNQPMNDQKDLANTIAYQMINNFPPVYVDVKDINNQQNILAQTVNRVNL